MVLVINAGVEDFWGPFIVAIVFYGGLIIMFVYVAIVAQNEYLGIEVMVLISLVLAWKIFSMIHNISWRRGLIYLLEGVTEAV